MNATKRAKPMSKTAREVVRGLAKGGKLTRLEADEVRMDFPNGDYWFLSQNVIKELVERGRLLPGSV